MGAAGAEGPLHPAPTRALAGGRVAHAARPGAPGRARARQAPQGITAVQAVVAAATGVAAEALHVVLETVERQGGGVWVNLEIVSAWHLVL